MSRLSCAVVLVSWGICASACSAVIGGRPGADDLLPCWVEGDFDPCPVGSHCLPDPETGSGICVRMSCSMEVCNGVDDDCDGMTDELDEPNLCPSGDICVDHACRAACELDADGDNFSSCTTPPDCDDTRADINPNAREICDGIDNDCDPSTTDLDPGLCVGSERCALARDEVTPRCFEPDCTNFIDCDSGFACDPTSGNCVPMVSDCRTGGTAACAPSTERCDPASGVCVTLIGLGLPCTSDVQCGSERCMTYGALGLPPDTTGAPGICIEACCEESDCEAGFRCWAPGNGVRACVPEADRPIGAAVMACSGPTCGASDVCDARVVPLTGVSTDALVTICTPYVPGTERNTLVACESHDDCASGYCIEPIVEIGPFPVPLGSGWCALPCRTAADCNYPIDPLVEAAAGDRTCGFQGFTSGERLQLCRDVGTVGPGANGASCSTNANCHDLYCRDSRCSAVCCTDASCGADEVCAPVNRSGWEMRCVPRISPPGSPG